MFFFDIFCKSLWAFGIRFSISFPWRLLWWQPAWFLLFATACCSVRHVCFRLVRRLRHRFPLRFHVVPVFFFGIFQLSPAVPTRVLNVSSSPFSRAAIFIWGKTLQFRHYCCCWLCQHYYCSPTSSRAREKHLSHFHFSLHFSLFAFAFPVPLSCGIWSPSPRFSMRLFVFVFCFCFFFLCQNGF